MELSEEDISTFLVPSADAVMPPEHITIKANESAIIFLFMFLNPPE
jgi:hypothetical protein